MKKSPLLLVATIILLTGCNYFGSGSTESVTPTVSTTSTAPVVPTTSSTDAVTPTGATTVTTVPAVTPTAPAITPVALSSDEDLIRSYYAKLAKQDLEGAFAMKYGSKTSYATFKDWYSTVKEVTLTDLKKLEDHKYQFIADLKEEGNMEEKYKVTMEVKNELLDTKSSEKIWDNFTVKAFAKLVGNERKIYVTKGGEDKLIYSWLEKDVNDGGEKLDGDPWLSHDEKYVMFSVKGLEWINTYVFNIDTVTKVHQTYGGSKVGFTNDGKYFYQCQESGLYGGEVKILNVPSFSLKANLADAFIHTCYGYNAASNTFKYSLSYDKDYTETMRVYAF